MKFIENYKKEILAFLLISIIYFALRLPNLTLQPIFADEAIYIRWAQIMKSEPTLRFLPLSDGKTPLFMWSMIPFFKILNDPLFAGRFLSVLSGYITTLGVLFLGWKFFNKKTGFLASLLVAITPFMFFFDRMALTDSMLAAFSIWSLNLALLLIKYQRIDLAMFLGYILGGGLLTKTSALLNILTLPLTLFLINLKDKERQKKILKLFGLFLISLIITLVIYNILRLGSGFLNLNSRNQDYVRSPEGLLIRPWDPILPHTRDLMGILPSYIGIPLILVTLFSFYLIFKKRNKIGIVIFLWSFIPIILQMIFLRVFTARYILFSIPPILVLSAYSLDYLFSLKLFKNNLVKIITMVVLLFWPLYFGLNLLTNPEKAPLFKNERTGYFEDWTAGYGLKEIAAHLLAASEKGTVVVGTEGFFGTLPDGLMIYLDKHSHQAPADKQIILIGSRATVSAQVRNASLDHQTFFVTNKSRYRSWDSDLKLIKEYPKAKSSIDDSMLFFQVPSK